MVRMIYCIMRREDVSLRNFRTFFNGEHKELVCQAAKHLKSVKFSQCLTLMVERNFLVMVRRGTEMPYDAVVELWWENAAEFDRIMETDAALKKTEELFTKSGRYIDFSKSRIFFTEQPRSCE